LLRLPLGQCRLCPSIILAPLLGMVASQRDQRAPRAAVKEDGRRGWGWSTGARVGIELAFHPRFGVRVEHGFEHTRLFHDVKLDGLGREQTDYRINRHLTTLGPWVRL
jgi:hypothetical protein